MVSLKDPKIENRETKKALILSDNGVVSEREIKINQRAERILRANDQIRDCRDNL